MHAISSDVMRASELGSTAMGIVMYPDFRCLQPLVSPSACCTLHTHVSLELATPKQYTIASQRLTLHTLRLKNLPGQPNSQVNLVAVEL